MAALACRATGSQARRRRCVTRCTPSSTSPDGLRCQGQQRQAEGAARISGPRPSSASPDDRRVGMQQRHRAVCLGIRSLPPSFMPCSTLR